MLVNARRARAEGAETNARWDAVHHAVTDYDMYYQLLSFIHTVLIS